MNWKPKEDKEAQRKALIKGIIEEEDAWEHIIIHYLSAISPMVKLKKDGTPDPRQNIGRLALRLSTAMGYRDSYFKEMQSRRAPE